MGKDNCLECNGYESADVGKDLVKDMNILRGVIHSLPRTESILVLLTNNNGYHENLVEYNRDTKKVVIHNISAEKVAAFYEKFSEETCVSYCPQCGIIQEGL